MGINWNLRTNEVKPNTYFNMVSRSTELCTSMQLDKSLKKTDEEFVGTCSKFLKDLPNLKNLKPHSKSLIPKGNKIKGVYSMRDGGIPAYSAINYMGSGDQRLLHQGKS